MRGVAIAYRCARFVISSAAEQIFRGVRVGIGIVLVGGMQKDALPVFVRDENRGHGGSYKARSTQRNAALPDASLQVPTATQPPSPASNAIGSQKSAPARASCRESHSRGRKQKLRSTASKANGEASRLRTASSSPMHATTQINRPERRRRADARNTRKASRGPRRPRAQQNSEPRGIARPVRSSSCRTM